MRKERRSKQIYTHHRMFCADCRAYTMHYELGDGGVMCKHEDRRSHAPLSYDWSEFRHENPEMFFNYQQSMRADL